MPEIPQRMTPARLPCIQSINQSITQSINQSINQFISKKQAASETTVHRAGRPAPME